VQYRIITEDLLSFGSRMLINIVQNMHLPIITQRGNARKSK